MTKVYNTPVVIQVYLGSGKKAERLRQNIVKMADKDSVSELIVRTLKKGEPALFKGVDNERPK